VSSTSWLARRRRTVGTVSVQLAFGSAEVDGPKRDDLEGLLCGPGEVVRQGGTARVSVVVTEPWRAESLLDLYATIDLAGDTAPAEGGGLSVRTPFTEGLAELAERWTTGALTIPPGDLLLDGGRLRAWLMAAGEPVPGRPDAWQLGLSATDAAWARVGAALAAAGVPGALVGPRRRGELAGAAYRVLGVRRLRRLRELVGPPPPAAPLLAWPTV
jgi:hypothetical protein